MYALLIRLMLIAALIEFGISVSNFEKCHLRQCVMMFHARALDVLKIDWKPISVWPEEAKKFR
jgi:hypothetical protein